MDPINIGHNPPPTNEMNDKSNEKKKKYHKHRHSHGAYAAPNNVSVHHWKDMLNMSILSATLIDQNDNNTDVTTDDNELLPFEINKLFKKRECIKFVRNMKESQRCGCGRLENEHSSEAINNGYKKSQGSDTEGDNIKEETYNNKNNYIRSNGRWSIKYDTELAPTDAYGTIEFQGGPRPIKSQYVRLSFDTDCSSIIHLLQNIWQIPPPKLIISIHGGSGNFNLQPKLSRLFRNGLVKSASTTGAWIITSGVENSLTRQVAAAIESAQNSIRNKTKIISIGIASWGLLKKKEDFIGEDHTVLYRKMGNNNKSRSITLNSRHSYFLFTDNGTVGKSGSEVVLRRRLETYINEKQTIVSGGRTVPVVCVMIEGGTYSIRTALQYVTSIPRTPIVVCDGSGRASDLISFAHKYIQDDGKLPEGLHNQLLSLIENVFQQNKEEAEHLLKDLLACVSQKRMVTIFRSGGEHKKDLDHAILTALLEGYNLTPAEQLSLALAWNRVDIARCEIFKNGLEWKSQDLHNIMMEALLSNRVDFVRLLLENGVDMQRFLTIRRLEDLYNTDKGPTNTLYYIVRDVTKIKHGYRYKLPHIGLAMEKLIGNGFKSYYTGEEFAKKYNKYKDFLKKKVDKKTGDNLASVIFPFAMMRSKNESPSNETTNTYWKSALKSTFSHNFQGKTKSVLINVDDSEYEKNSQRQSSTNLDNIKHQVENEIDFRYPFSELLIWAVLTKRHDMARCMWEHGEESMAKALVACCLNKNLAKEAREDYLDIEISDDLKRNADEFKQLSLDLLDCCYRQDDDKTLQLLTYELKYWGHETNLSLAVVANNKQFIAHPCCQMLLADLWHGGMRIRSNSHLKVIMGILFFPSIFALEFKSKEELMLQPQTAAEHENDVYDTSSSEGEFDGSDSESSISSGSDDDQELYKNKSFFGSNQSLHLSSILPNKLRRSRKDTNRHRRQSITSTTSNSKSNLHKSKFYNVSITSLNDTISQTQGNRRRMSSTCKEILDASKLPPKDLADRRVSISKRRQSTTTANLKNITSIETTAKPTVPLKSKQIKAKRKLYEFFFAPITTFWTWFLSFFVFMAANTYVLLIQTPEKPTILEWILFLYVLSFGLEEFRKLFMSEPTRIKAKVTFFFSNTWNWLASIAVVGYLIGFGVRIMIPPTGRVILAVDYSIWCLKILDYLTVHPTFGPYVTMVGKMINAMLYHVTLLFISLLSFGLVRQSILVIDQNWNWELLRDVFYKPYFMLYGEVYAGEIDLCTDEGRNCVPGNFIPPLMMTFFLLIANLLLISMLMATFNHIFEEVNSFAKNYWLFQRYHQVMKYESSPVLPPPFTMIYHIYWIGKYMYYQNTFNIRTFLQKIGLINDNYSKNVHLFDCSLKLFLTLSQVEKLHDFEEEGMEALTLQQEHIKKTAVDSKIKNTSDNTDAILSRMTDIVRSEGALKETVNLIEKRLGTVERTENELLEHIRCITELLPSILPNYNNSRSRLNSEQFSDNSNVFIDNNTSNINSYLLQDLNTSEKISRRNGYSSITDTIDVKNYNQCKEDETDVADVYTEDDKCDFEDEDYSN